MPAMSKIESGPFFSFQYLTSRRSQSNYVQTIGCSQAVPTFSTKFTPVPRL
jgi:hypothetical protein